jgi:NADPH:quinone reductase-like Zn-dependent oxidoreductase
MRQVVMPRYGPPEVLTVRDVPEPHARAGEVRIRVAAAGVNFSDLLARAGLYPDAPKPPMVMGYEVAGTVDEVGAGVTTLRSGDRVVAITRFGGQSELVVVPAGLALPLEPSWSFEEGAGLPVVYLTAHHMLVRVAAARAGETVLVHGAAGGVGLAVAELARILGLRVIGLASRHKHEVLRSYGVEPVDGNDPRWWEAIRRIAPRGVDVVLDGVGGDSWRRGYALLAPTGRLVMFGVSDLLASPTRRLLRTAWHVLRFPRFGPLNLMNHNRSVAGVNMAHLWNEDALVRPQLAALLQHAAAGKIRPRIDRAFPFSQAGAAHRYLHERRNIGKVVLVPG